MNTARSFWFGWGSLIVGGVGAYIFAKRSIHADRQVKYEQQRKKREAVMESLEYSNNVSSQRVSSATMGGGSGGGGTATNGGPAREDPVGSPSQESSSDPAPTRHAPATEGQRVLEKSKYESAVPYKSTKGDRFS